MNVGGERGTNFGDENPFGDENNGAKSDLSGDERGDPSCNTFSGLLEGNEVMIQSTE